MMVMRTSMMMLQTHSAAGWWRREPLRVWSIKPTHECCLGAAARAIACITHAYTM